jgi:hypothetical protein
VTVKRQQGGVVSEFLHSVAEAQNRKDGNTRPEFKIWLRVIEGRFILPSAYWNAVEVDSWHPSARFQHWRDRSISAQPKSENLVLGPGVPPSSSPPPLRLLFLSAGIGCTPLMSLLRFLSAPILANSSSVVSAVSDTTAAATPIALPLLRRSPSSFGAAPFRCAWVSVYRSPVEVCFLAELQRIQRLARTSVRLILHLAFFFTRATSQQIQNFTTFWRESIAMCQQEKESAGTDQQKAEIHVFSGRPTMEAVRTFLNSSKQSADLLEAQSGSATASPSYTSLSYMCGPLNFQQWGFDIIKQIHQKQPELLSEKIKVEEFTY